MSAEKPQCGCPTIDDYRIRKRGCPVHGESDTRVLAAKEAERQAVADRESADDLAAAWSDYRKDYGVPLTAMSTAHKAFAAGWKAAREGDQSGVLR